MIVGNIGATLAPNYISLLVARFISGLPYGAYLGGLVVDTDLRYPALLGIPLLFLGLSADRRKFYRSENAIPAFKIPSVPLASIEINTYVCKRKTLLPCQQANRRAIVF